MILGVKDLDAAIAKFADVLPASSIHADVVGVAEFSPGFARFAIGANELAIAGKNLDAMIARIRDIEAILGIDA